MERRRAPFVIAVLSEVAQARGTAPKPRLKDRPLVSITPDNLLHFEGRTASAGLSFLVRSLAGNPGVKPKLWDVSKRELLRDCQRSPWLNWTALFKRVYEEGIGTLGGEPVGCIVPDHALTNSPEDFELARSLSEIAAAAGAPVLYGLAPAMFAVDSWSAVTTSCPRVWQEVTAVNPQGKDLRAWRGLDYLFGLLPNLLFDGGGAAAPGFLIAHAIGLAFQNAGIRGLFELEPRPPFTFEWDCPLDLQAAFRQVGLNALSAASVAQADFLQHVRPLSDQGEIVNPPPSLAECLAESHLYQRWCDYRRRKKVSGDEKETAELGERWLSELDPDLGRLVNLARLERRIRIRENA